MVNKMIKKYIYNILIGIDQLANAIAFGDPDETISSRLGKNHSGSWLEKLVNWMFRKQTDNHCKNAIEEDEAKHSLIK